MSRLAGQAFFLPADLRLAKRQRNQARTRRMIHPPMDVDAMTAFSPVGLSLRASCPRTAAAVPPGLAVLVTVVICAPVFVLAVWSGIMTDVVKELGTSFVRLIVDLSPELAVVCVS